MLSISASSFCIAEYTSGICFVAFQYGTLYPSPPQGNRNHPRCLFRQISLVASCFPPFPFPTTFSDLQKVYTCSIASFTMRSHKSKHKQCKVLHFQNPLLYGVCGKKKKSVQHVRGSHNCSFNTGWWKLSITQISAKKELVFPLFPITLITEEPPEPWLVFCLQPSGCCLKTAAQQNVPVCWASSLCDPQPPAALDPRMAVWEGFSLGPGISCQLCYFSPQSSMEWCWEQRNHHYKPISGDLMARLNMAGQNYHRVGKCWTWQ